MSGAVLLFKERYQVRYTVRNWVAVAAWNRNGGTHNRSRNEARGGQRNEQREYLDEYQDEIEMRNLHKNEDVNDCWD